MATRDPRMEAHLVVATLWRRRGTAALAALAVAIGASVASALLHVSGDVGRKLTHELRALGPNLLLVPTQSEDSDSRGTSVPEEYLDQPAAAARFTAAGLEGLPLLYVVAEVNGQPVQVVGTDVALARRLHPSWRIGPGDPGSLMGARLAGRLGVKGGEPLELTSGGTRRLARVAGARLEAGGPDDDAWWIPLAEAQALGGLSGRVSLYQSRVDGGDDRVRRAIATLERGGGMRALALHALSATEAGLLQRMRRLMALVTAAALLSAGLCAFGTLTDLALERRRDIALLKSLGASRRDIVRQFVAESLAIGAVGGVAGWLVGLFFAEVIGREVFHSVIAVRWDVPPLVLALSLGVAAFASLGPIRLALAVEPAAALKGD